MPFRIVLHGLFALLGLGLGLPLHAQTSVTASSEYTETGSGNIVTNLPGNFGLGTNVNNLIGANRFYDAGITGQNTVTANVEAGHVWNGQETLTHVTQFAHDAAAFGTTTNDLFDRHATWVASHIGGRMTAVNSGAWQMGIAPGTDLRSGAIASAWAGSAFTTAFNFNAASFNGGYVPYFGTADVINSSWVGHRLRATVSLPKRWTVWLLRTRTQPWLHPLATQVRATTRWVSRALVTTP